MHILHSGNDISIARKVFGIYDYSGVLSTPPKFCVVIAIPSSAHFFSKADIACNNNIKYS